MKRSSCPECGRVFGPRYQRGAWQVTCSRRCAARRRWRLTPAQPRRPATIDGEPAAIWLLATLNRGVPVGTVAALLGMAEPTLRAWMSALGIHREVRYTIQPTALLERLP